jgi:dihydrofolate reductase
MPAMPRPTLALIAAVARNGAIGMNNALLAHLPDDLPRFKRLTMGCPIIMGRKTWESIGRPLPGRRNIVVTRDPQWHSSGAQAAPSMPAALELASDAPKVFVIGGAQIYAQALPMADELHLTEIDAEFDADAYFPDWRRADFEEVAREPQRDAAGLKFSFVTYQRKRRT